MKYLLDTNILSETRKRKPAPEVLLWIDTAHQKDLFISVLTIGELVRGITQLRRTDPRAADSLGHWCQGIEKIFSNHIVDIDFSTAKIWGEMNSKRPYPVIDSLLAATALVHDMTLVTRNIKDIKDSGVTYLNPWDE